MEDIDKARELMAKASAFLEDAHEASIEGQSANSRDEIEECAELLFSFTKQAIAFAREACSS